MSKIEPSPFLSGVTPYRTPMAETPVDLYLNSNEGGGPPPEVLAAVARAGVENVRRYPDASRLTQRVASMLGVDATRVLLTAGADDGLARVTRAVLAPGREAILPSPTFEMIEPYARMAGATVRPIFWPFGPLPVDDILSAVTHETALVVVVTPNSPMGQTATAAELRRLSRTLPDTLVLVDLAYTDFADEDLTQVALGLPNVVIARTLSKAWGLAGLRVGFLAGPATYLSWCRAAGNPYAVSALSLAVAEERLRTGAGDVTEFISRVRQHRAELTRRLASLGAETAPSQGNFVFARFRDALWVRDAVAGLGVAVRAFPGRPYLEGGIRITVPGDSAEFDRLVQVIETVLVPEALLFDIDDTLADVTDSYRQAIIATAASLGVVIANEDITAAKAAGDANNDWELTWRMVVDAGVGASLAEITERFEALYQGTEERPGFKSTERLLCEPALLERLGARIPLGIVTGRPRSDAVEFLEKMGIEKLFGAVVTMDDAALKPSPEPVRLALKQLGVTRAWMVGDTPDDMRAARNAGVLPLGIVAPADDPDKATTALIASGAGRVLLDLYELETRLP